MEDDISINSILTEWEKFISIVKDNPTARQITIEAWNRCKEFGLEMYIMKFEFLSKVELEQRRRKSSQLIEISKSYMDSLSLSLTGVPHMIALSDNEGWIIDFRGTPEELGGRNAGFCIGASWSEKNIGNNGIGTALAVGEPVLIYGAEHYGTTYGGCACIGVPIKINGQSIGGLDISVPVQYAHPARLHIAIACVNFIETTMSRLDSNSYSIAIDKKMSVMNELIATAVHDLKNPLICIKHYE
jgi:transcriptional regulator of acetoin/glycerol metabolism